MREPPYSCVSPLFSETRLPGRSRAGVEPIQASPPHGKFYETMLALPFLSTASAFLAPPKPTRTRRPTVGGNRNQHASHHVPAPRPGPTRLGPLKAISLSINPAEIQSSASALSSPPSAPPSPFSLSQSPAPASPASPPTSPDRH